MAPTVAEVRVDTELARLHVITPIGTDDDVLTGVEAVLAGGAPLVQLRRKGGADRPWFRLATEVVRRCHEAAAMCVVNDRPDIAAASGADGVHLGDDDLPVVAARRILGPGAWVGATCRDPDAGRRAQDQGATYLGVGPAFATATKAALPDPIGPEGVARVAAAVEVPVVAIGGVTAGRVGALLDAGAYGVAVTGAVFAGPDFRTAIAELVAALDAWRSGLQYAAEPASHGRPELGASGPGQEAWAP